MKKITLLVVLFITVLKMQAQKDFQGVAVYESKTSTADLKAGMGRAGREITPDMQKMIEERMKKAFEKTFILNFDKSASIYKEEEKLDAPGAQGNGGMGRMISSFAGGGGTMYKNIKEKTYTSDKEFMGKEFLVHDSLTVLNWKMESETRQIGGYTCYKATAVKPVSKSDFRNFRRKNTDDKSEGKKEDTKADVKKEEDRRTDILKDIEIPKEILVTAWYAPEIPVSQGPDNYWGLPGLILEVNDGRTTILCSKIIMNAKDKVEIKAPKGGKVLTQKEYDEIVIKKMEEMRNANPNGRREMRIGG